MILHRSGASQRQAMAATITKGERAMIGTAGSGRAEGVDEPWGNTVLVELEDGIAWVAMNRPDKRNAMNPAMNREMNEVLDALEVDDRCGVLVLTGAGESFSAGMDLKEYFRETDDKSRIVQVRARRDAFAWQGAKLMHFAKPTIAMVNGWCFGGAFTPMASCDLAIAADEATFGVSEINWGILPGGNVTKVLSQLMGRRAALHAIMTGIPFDGRKAAAMGLVNESVPLAQLRERTRELARTLLEKNPTVLHQAKVAFRNVEDMPWEVALDYLGAKNEQGILIDPERGRQQGLKQFLDDKSYRPGLKAMKRGG
jgi:trans-feruloyl-CoA hydratase/vanillin synthase